LEDEIQYLLETTAELLLTSMESGFLLFQLLLSRLLLFLKIHRAIFATASTSMSQVKSKSEIYILFKEVMFLEYLFLACQ